MAFEVKSDGYTVEVNDRLVSVPASEPDPEPEAAPERDER